MSQPMRVALWSAKAREVPRNHPHIGPPAGAEKPAQVSATVEAVPRRAGANVEGGEPVRARLANDALGVAVVGPPPLVDPHAGPGRHVAAAGPDLRRRRPGGARPSLHGRAGSARSGL